MKKIIPFNKRIEFEDNLYEVTSISLEHTLHREDRCVCGNFTVSGEYRVTETSSNTLSFSYDLPFTIDIDDKYNIDNMDIDINDFYYEILDNKYLVVNIEVKIDHIEEVIERDDSMKDKNINQVKDSCVEKEDPITIPDDRHDNNAEIFEEPDDATVPNELPVDDNVADAINKQNDTDATDTVGVKSIFAGMSKTDTYVTYKVYIMREADTLDTVISNYKVTKELLEQYNDLHDIKIGDKLIIPYVKN